MDLVPQFNALLAKHTVKPISPPNFRPESLDAFLREAYTIVHDPRTNRLPKNSTSLPCLQNKRITELTAYLRSIRSSYLSTAPSRRKSPANTLTDTQRTQIDAESKALLRELNHAITSLSEAESVRQSTESTLALKKRARQGLGALGRWAAGGAITALSPKELEEQDKANTIKMFRESVIWYLQRELGSCGQVQAEMMEVRITREVEKSKSALWKARGSAAAAPNGNLQAAWSEMTTGSSTVATDHRYDNSAEAASRAALEEEERKAVEQQLSPEQLQLFEHENQGMLKQFEDTIDQVR